MGLLFYASTYNRKENSSRTRQNNNETSGSLAFSNKPRQNNIETSGSLAFFSTSNSTCNNSSYNISENNYFNFDNNVAFVNGESSGSIENFFVSSNSFSGSTSYSSSSSSCGSISTIV